MRLTENQKTGIRAPQPRPNIYSFKVRTIKSCGYDVVVAWDRAKVLVAFDSP